MALLDKIKDRSAVIGVVGLGYVGLPLAVLQAKIGYRVIGVDEVAEKVNRVNRAENYISDVEDRELKEGGQSDTGAGQVRSPRHARGTGEHNVSRDHRGSSAANPHGGRAQGRGDLIS